MITGGCLCGAVRYRIDGALTRARSCHCSRCRKAFGGAGSAYAELARPGSLGWLSGEQRLRRYNSSGRFGLAFCGVCGSTLCGLFDEQVHGVALGSVDGDPGVEIGAHLFVASKAPWDHIGGPAPRYAGHPPDEEEQR